MKVKDFFDALTKNRVSCFCGVPDSLLKDFCAYLTDNALGHTITANEGNAVALAAGHYLATGNPALVYMQNSGIGNCVNPLLSLTDEDVYNIPLLMLIGWRGEPGVKDEPQHIKQGKITCELLDVIGVKYEILPENISDALPLLESAFHYMQSTKKPYAFIVRKGTFEKYSLQNKKSNNYELKREDAIKIILNSLSVSDIVVSTTGHISREVYEIRESFGQNHRQDFLTVGSMGHASSIALGIAIEKPDRNVYCFDGDGAFLMHQGSIAVNASKNLSNFKHIVFNNEAHDSVGSQPTVVSNMNISKLAEHSGYERVYSVSTQKDLEYILSTFIKDKCTSLLEVKVKCGARDDLGRPKETPCENKKVFMENLRQIEFRGPNSINNLHSIILSENVNKVLVFTGKKSFENIKGEIESVLANCNVLYFNNFSPNPKEEDLKVAIDTLNVSDFDIILAVGGGSVIDFAKAYRYYTKSSLKLIAVPTTCGTGSEATQFSVLYINGAKTSIDEASLLPEYAILDSRFVTNNPKYLKACTAMDAYCQAIESFWSVKSTVESREYAVRAIELCRDNIVEYVNSNSKTASERMMIASNFAGKAINISRTTASHALSYKITTDYSIPHGHAVALTIAPLMLLNSMLSEESCNDSRGTDFVLANLKKLQTLISSEPIKYFHKLYRDIGLEYDFGKLGIKDFSTIVDSVNIDRLKNNPRKLTKENLHNLFLFCNSCIP